jgi:hypothetical protein
MHHRAGWSAGGSPVAAFLNACGSTYGEPVNGWLSDRTPVITSVCVGPAGDASDGHYIYYYRDHLNKTDEALVAAGAPAIRC